MQDDEKSFSISTASGTSKYNILVKSVDIDGVTRMALLFFTFFVRGFGQ